MKDLIDHILTRAERNNYAKIIGIRTEGEYQAGVYLFFAELARKRGESSERIEDLINLANRELELDKKASRIAPTMNNPLAN